MNLQNLWEKMNDAFEKAHVQKYDTCTLWTCLACDLLWNDETVAYPLYGSMKFFDEVSGVSGHYDDKNDSFHMVSLVFFKANDSWFIMDFSTKYLISSELKKVSLPICPVVIEVPDLNGVNPKDTLKIEEVVHSIDDISVRDEVLNYSFYPETVHAELNTQNEAELTKLESAM